MKILLTGATGFVGSQILAQLLERGHEVRAVVRESTIRELTLSNQKLELVEVKDLFNAEQELLRKLLKGTDVVIHGAWNVSSQSYLFRPTTSTV